MRNIKRFYKWYLKRYAETYGKLIEMGISPVM